MELVIIFIGILLVVLVLSGGSKSSRLQRKRQRDSDSSASPIQMFDGSGHSDYSDCGSGSESFSGDGGASSSGGDCGSSSYSGSDGSGGASSGDGGGSSNVVLHEGDYTKCKKLAVWFGREGTGISDVALENSELCINIPMYEIIESLNLGTASGIVLYEITKQRRLFQENLKRKTLAKRTQQIMD